MTIITIAPWQFSKPCISRRLRYASNHEGKIDEKVNKWLLFEEILQGKFCIGLLFFDLDNPKVQGTSMALQNINKTNYICKQNNPLAVRQSQMTNQNKRLFALKAEDQRKIKIKFPASHLFVTKYFLV